MLALSSVAIQKSSRGVDGGSPELDSIAVLPFSDLSPQRDQEYFCDGMTDGIIDALTKVGGLRVVARTSSFAFKGKQQDIREIGRMLNVGAVLATMYLDQGQVDQFNAELAKVPGTPMACRTGLSRAVGAAFLGKKQEALEEVQKWEHPPEGIYVRPSSIAGVYAALSDREHTFQWLEKARDERDGMLAYIKYQGTLRKFRADPRFKDLVKRVGLQ